MDITKFNAERSEAWTKKFNADNARIFLIVGKKENGNFTFITEEGATKERVAQQLEQLAKAVRLTDI